MAEVGICSMRDAEDAAEYVALSQARQRLDQERLDRALYELENALLISDISWALAVASKLRSVIADVKTERCEAILRSAKILAKFGKGENSDAP